MNQKQRACIWMGLALFVLAGLFPWSSYYAKYVFLLSPYAIRLDLQRLSLEMTLIVILASVLCFMFRGATDSVIPSAGSRKWRLLFSSFAALALCLGVVSYIEVRKVRRLEAGIQNAKSILDSNSTRFTPIPAPPGYTVQGKPNGSEQPPAAPVGKLTPFPSPEQAEYNRVVNFMLSVVDEKDETLKRVKEELDRLN